MANDGQQDVRSSLLEALMDKVQGDTYPSATMLDMVESLLTPDEVATYAEALLSRIRADRFPSVSLIQRVQSLI